jgi:hypothetical protein
MAVRLHVKDRWASVLLWVGRAIAGAWGVIFLLSISAELASGYLPGGNTFTSVLNFASGALLLVGVALSFWHAWVGGMALIIVWAATNLSLLLGLEPQADVPTGLVFGALTALLPGLLLITASMMQHQRANAEATGKPIHKSA